MNKIIPFDKKFEFSFLEEKDLQFEHPASDYYFKLNDLSINIDISLKWIEWGFFFKSISTEITDPEFAIEFVLDKQILDQWDFSKKNSHKILIDDRIVDSENELSNLIKTNYSSMIYNENTKIHITLKLNLDEYLLLNNVYFPTLIPF